jgi:glutathione peroxidase
MFSKVDVNGDDQAPLYTLLKTAQPGEGESSEIGWNFTKFLVDGSGNVVARWEPMTTPEEIGAQLDQFR